MRIERKFYIDMPDPWLHKNTLRWGEFKINAIYNINFSIMENGGYLHDDDDDFGTSQQELSADASKNANEVEHPR
jgi:hypothetical protein